jgi:hypothetical protein
VYYWQLRDTEAAVRWFRLAAAQPEAPNWLEPLAATILLEGGDRTSARFLLQQILTSEARWLQRMAVRGLMQVDALDAIEQLQGIVARFPPPAGARYSWEDLVQRRALRGFPLDPTGVPFDLDPVTGAVSVSPRSELYPMPAPRMLR